MAGSAINEVSPRSSNRTDTVRISDAGGRHGYAAPQNPWKLPAASPPAFAERLLLRAWPCRPLIGDPAIALQTIR